MVTSFSGEVKGVLKLGIVNVTFTNFFSYLCEPPEPPRGWGWVQSNTSGGSDPCHYG
jgi:hypothetical protein